MPDHQTWLGTPAERLLVQAAGWHLDEDDWWTRPVRPKDTKAVRIADPDGTQSFVGFKGTYCRTAIQALAIDHIRSTLP